MPFFTFDQKKKKKEEEEKKSKRSSISKEMLKLDNKEYFTFCIIDREYQL
jgi:hypothetical protein